MSRIEADYRIETAYPLAEAAEAMAGEQSSGTFLPIPGETPELKARSRTSGRFRGRRFPAPAGPIGRTAPAASRSPGPSTTWDRRCRT
jgi:ribulose-bisphosphate carboxylase large chain